MKYLYQETKQLFHSIESRVLFTHYNKKKKKKQAKLEAIELTEVTASDYQGEDRLLLHIWG